MADNSILPKAGAPLVDQTGRPTRAFYSFFNALVSNLQGQINTITKLVKNLALVIAALGGDPDSGEGIPDISGQIDAKADKSITITGLGSIQGGGDLSQDRYISLDGDVDDVPGVSFYGSPDGATKGWAAFSGNFAPSMDADDNVTLDLAEVADAGGGTLQRTAFDAYGRKTGSSAATTTDLTEGDNLYFTDERAQDAAGAALDGTGDVPLTYDDGGNKISAALSAGVRAQITDNLLPAGYIDGLKMVWVSGTALTVTSGAAYVPGLGKVLRAPAAIAKTGLSLTVSTWYHVYLYDNAGTPDVEIVTTVPAAAYNGTARAKTGDTSRRYVGSVKAGASGQILQFRHGNGDVVDYYEDLNTADLFLLSNGLSTTKVTVSAASAVPVTARRFRAFAEFTESVGARNAYIYNPANLTALLAFIRAKIMILGEITLDSSQTFAYAVSSGSTAGLYVWVSGYSFER